MVLQEEANCRAEDLQDGLEEALELVQRAQGPDAVRVRAGCASLWPESAEGASLATISAVALPVPRRRRCPDAAAAAAAAAAADGDARRLDAVFEILRELQGGTVLEDPKRRHYNGMEDALRLGHEGPGIRKNK